MTRVGCSRGDGMRTVAILVAILLLGAPLASWSRDADGAAFKGAWFEVWVPPTFAAIPSMKSSSSAEGVDSAFFRSPDRQVELYVFSPQWNGEPQDIALNRATERLASSETKSYGKKTVRFFTIQSKDGTYTRSYQDTHSPEDNTRFVVGIKYADRSAYDRYKDVYLKFKASLRQFAD
jgi:hypothetical protein